MGSKKHEPSYFRPPRSSICQRNPFRFVCGAGAKTKNVLLERRHKRNWRLCSLCKSIYEWRVFTWCSGELSTKINYRMEPERSEEHTSELQSRFDIVCRLLIEKKKNIEY